MSASTTRAPSTGAIGGGPVRDSLTRRFLARTESKVGLILTGVVLLVAILGPSGCGKSTLFNIVGGLITDFDGSVRVDGHEIRGPHREIGMVFQSFNLFPHLKAIDNVTLGPRKVRGVPKAEADQQAMELLGRMLKSF